MGGGLRVPKDGGMALEEVGQVERTAEDAGFVDVENGVPGERGKTGDVATTEEREEERCAAESGTGTADGAGGVSRAAAPGAGPEGAAGDLDGGGGDWEAEKGGARGAPVREAGAGGNGKSKDGAEVRGEAEGEVGLKPGDLCLGEARTEGDESGAEVGEDGLSEGAKGEKSKAAGRGGMDCGGGAGGETAEASGVGR